MLFEARILESFAFEKHGHESRCVIVNDDDVCNMQMKCCFAYNLQWIIILTFITLRAFSVEASAFTHLAVSLTAVPPVVAGLIET
jgi:hypothetical protein